MSLSTCSQPSLEMTGRLGSSARVRRASSARYACCAGEVATSSKPQLSLIGTQVTMRWMATVASHEVCPLVGEQPNGLDRRTHGRCAVSAHTISPSRSAQ